MKLYQQILVLVIPHADLASISHVNAHGRACGSVKLPNAILVVG